MRYKLVLSNIQNFFDMKKGKCLLFIRTSTDSQETRSQLKETKEYAESKGYKDFVVLEQRGASAYKVTNKYVELVDELKNTILNDKDITAVAVFALNRLSRNPSKAHEIEEFLVEHKIQLHCKIPEITLLNDDGTENDGAGMVFSIYAKISQLEINELRLKVQRARKRDKALHKYIGGRIPFGYMIDENRLVVPSEDADIVRQLFDLYGTGEWSYMHISKEFNERYGLNWDKHNMRAILMNRNYYNDAMFPPIITEAQFDKAAEQRAKSTSRPQSHKNIRFAAKLIECPVCGRHYTANIRDYRCINDCNNKRISISNMDGLLWFIASHLESQRMLTTDTKEELLQKKAVLDAKITSVGNYTAKGEKRVQRAKKMALEGLIEIEEFKNILKEVETEQEETRLKVEQWKSEIADIDRLIAEDTMSMKRILEISDSIDAYDEEQMFTIVHRWVKGITFTDDWVFTIETVTRTYQCRYNRYGYPSRWFTLNGNALAVPRFTHNKNGDSALVPNKCTVKDIPNTLAWLGGSEIV